MKYLLLLFLALPLSASADPRPNIVWIFSDDHAYQAISAYSNRLTETPNIDRLADEGIGEQCIRFDPGFFDHRVFQQAMHQDYIKFARAKGLRPRRVVGVHLMKNILIPVVTVLGLIGRGSSLVRNATLKHKSTPQSAIGIRDSRIRQVAQGAMGGSFNTREFFHGRTRLLLKMVKWGFLTLAFAVPVALLWAGLSSGSGALMLAAAGVQYLGLLMERWYFFAEASHPQNLYYQAA